MVKMPIILAITFAETMCIKNTRNPKKLLALLTWENSYFY
jgi:hypothetical protein